MKGIADDLRARILQGTYQSGTKLPTETELIGEFGASRNTVRNALRVLQGEGLTVSVQGGGTTVRERPDPVILDPDFLTAATTGFRETWETLSADQGFDGTSEILSVEKVIAPPHIASRLGTEKAVLRDRVLSRDGKRIRRLKTYYPTWLATGTLIARKPPVLPTVLHYLEHDLGHTVAYHEGELASRAPTRDERELLGGLPPGVPILTVIRTFTDPDGTVLLVDDDALAADTFVFRYGPLPGHDR